MRNAPALPPPAAKVEEPRRTHQARQDGTQYPYPVCHVCNGDVEAFCWSDHQNRADELTRTFFCMCHGQTETVSIPMATLRAMRNFRIERAFAPHVEPEADAKPVPRALPPPRRAAGVS